MPILCLLDATHKNSEVYRIISERMKESAAQRQQCVKVRDHIKLIDKQLLEAEHAKSICSDCRVCCVINVNTSGTELRPLLLSLVVLLSIRV